MRGRAWTWLLVAQPGRERDGLPGKEVTRLEAAPRTAPSVVLAPRPGSADAPVNGFAVCWQGGQVTFDDIRVQAFDADGNPVSGP